MADNLVIRADLDCLIAQITTTLNNIQAQIGEFRKDVNNCKRDRGGESKRRNQIANQDFKTMTDIPYFSGCMHEDEFLDWMDEVDRFFEIMGVPEHKQAKIVSNRLKKTAADWWDNLQSARKMQGKEPVRTWRKMKGILREKFLPRDFSIKNYYSKVKERTFKIEQFALPIVSNILIEEKPEEAPQEIVHEPTKEAQQDITYEFSMEEVSQEIIQEVKDEIVCVDMVINIEESLEPQVNHSDLDVNEEYNFGSQEESVQVAYDKLIFGVEFMIVPLEYAEDHVNNPQVQVSNLLSGYSSTYSGFPSKMNSRASSFQVEESDVGRDFDQFQRRILKSKKRLHIKKIGLNIENWYSNRLLNDEINQFYL
ncbi:hypothetical protein ACLB2K_076073 [Fragaria x ananassa]